MEPLLLSLGLLANGIATGVMVSTVIGLAPMTLAWPFAGYVTTVQFLWRRYDPLMPALNTFALLMDVFVLAFGTTTATRALAGSALILLAVVMVISVWKNVPINRYVMSLDPENPPDDWARVDPRRRWRNWNLLRTTLAIAAFAANVTALAVQP
jgi:hypothetical protein